MSLARAPRARRPAGAPREIVELHRTSFLSVLRRLVQEGATATLWLEAPEGAAVVALVEGEVTSAAFDTIEGVPALNALVLRARGEVAIFDSVESTARKLRVATADLLPELRRVVGESRGFDSPPASPPARDHESAPAGDDDGESARRQPAAASSGEPAAERSRALAELEGPAKLEALPQPGDVVGRYLVTGRLGRGGTSVVFRALHTGLQAEVALKVLIPGASGKERRLSLGEARLLARLDHPAILRVRDFEGHGRFPYLVLDCVSGISLAALIRQAGAIRPHRAARLVSVLCDGLAYALEREVLHRDLKPANVLLDREGSPLLADLGAPALHGDDSSPVGTPAYMAPERILNPGEEDHRADIYALGVTLFEMLTGRLPFQAPDAIGLLRAHRDEPPPVPRALVPDLPDELSRLVLAMLAKAPGDRPVYAEIARQLEPWKSAEPPESSRSTVTRASVWRSLGALFSSGAPS